ncbi:MAG: hypothetical protein RLZZ584_4455 [Pseudomonadota bacterium]|jgi:RimJ/RimL family protein N-acetyltransferase
MALRPYACGQVDLPGLTPMNTLPIVPGYTVRPITLDDAPAWAHYVCRPEVMRHTSSTATTADELRPMLERMLAGGPEAPVRFVIQRAGEAAIIATVGFHTISALNGTAEITYDVAPGHWGRGIATVACRAATAWGFTVRGWHRIQGTTLLANIGSQRVLERCGYRREGVLRNFRIVRGRPADYLMHAVIAGDPLNRAADATPSAA